MIFKLVRTDSIDSCKIQLPTGVHKFGRNLFLDCEDKRVSRCHGQLDVKDASVTLKALHQNPCFYTKGSEDTEILRLNCTVDLSNGDKFGLLPDCYWYEILHCALSPDISTNTDTRTEQCSQKSNGNEMNDKLNESEQLDFQLDESLVNPERSESPSILPPVNESSLEQKEIMSVTQDYQIEANELKRPLATDISDNDVAVKKIKTEMKDITTSNNGDLQAGPSNSNEQVKVEPSSPPVKPLNNHPARERCMYGAQCYRKNPQHKAMFSHPSDVDWGDGPRGTCPRGAGCVKRDPRHWRDHDHPPGTRPPPPGYVRKPKKQRHYSESSEEDQEVSSPPVVDLPTKRARKPVQRQHFSDSGSDEPEDPFMSDGSTDEWQPYSAHRAKLNTQSP